MGSIEECVGVDDKILREVIIPVMAVPRRALDGTTCETEPVNKSQIYINILVILRYLYQFQITNNTIYTILRHQSYQDYWQDYQKITNEQKQQLVSLLRNQQK